MLAACVAGPIDRARAQAPAAQDEAPSQAANQPQIEEDAEIRRLVETMDKAEKAVADAKDRDERLAQLRGAAEGILADSTRIAEALRPRLADVKSQIERLGPAPAKDAPPEAPAVAAERARQIGRASCRERV